MFLPRLLPFDETACRKSRSSRPAHPAQQVSHGRLGDNGVLVLSEGFLKLLRPVDERAADAGRLCRVPNALDADPRLVQVLVDRILVKRIDGLAQALVFAFRRPAEGFSLPESRRMPERGPQLREPRRVQCDDKIAARLVPFLVDDLEECAERGAVQRIELPDEIVDQDVPIADLTEQRGEPLELCPKALPFDAGPPAVPVSTGAASGSCASRP